MISITDKREINAANEIYEVNCQNNLYDLLLKHLVSKYGVLLNTAQVAETLAISTRTLNERRKAGKDCPEHLPGSGKNIYYPVQNVVKYQLLKSNQCIKIY